MSTKQESIATFYSPKFEQSCHLCQHGLHGTEVQTQSNGIMVGEPVVVYQTPEVVVSQTFGQPIPVKRGITLANQKHLQSTNSQRDITQQNQIKSSPTLPREQQINHQAELKNLQQISTFYSGKYEQQCYLCQHGLHGKEIATTVQKNIAPEIMLPQNIGQPLTAKNTTTNQNFSQIINTPPRNDYIYSQQLQQSPIQNIQLNVPQTQQIIQTNTQQLQYSPVQNIQYNVQQPQIIPQVVAQNYFSQQIPQVQVQDHSVTSVPQQIISETTTTIQEQQITAQEQVESYWRYKVYELQDRIYELMNQISLLKQGNLYHQRTGSQIKKYTEDTLQVEQVKQEIFQLENQLKGKQKNSIDLRNKLNIMIYRQDPTDETTKYKEQELQQLRQKYNTLNFKHQSNVEDIAMIQAIIEAIKSGKGYKLVSVREQQQTSSYNQSYKGQQQYNQVQ